MMKRWKTRTLAYTIGILLLVGGVGLIVGCGQHSTAPVVQNDDAGIVVDPKHGGNPADASGFIADAFGTVTRVVRDVVEVIGTSGGQICTSLGNGRKCGLDVPSGALNSRTAISMRVEDLEGRKSAALIDFGPDGLVFNKATTLFFDVRDPNGSVKTLSWWNPDSECWVVQGTAQVKNGRVTFPLYHFSKYGIN